MNKKCLGCGIKLQDKEVSRLGYTPKLENDYCMRCFKLKNYGKNINNNIPIDNEAILKRINETKYYTLFLTDFLHINNEVIDTYKKIKNNKCLVITKKDLFPNNVIIEKFLNNIRKVYDINSNIYFISTHFNLDEFYKELIYRKRVLLTGYTSVGKSSLINKLTNSHIMESKESTTTLDFIEIKNGDTILYDTPGFIYKNNLEDLNFNKRIRPNIKQLKSNEEIKINDYILNSNIDNNFIFYIPNHFNIIKRKNTTKLNNRINIPANSDLIIKGWGFINIKSSCIVSTNIDLNLIEIRDSLIGAHHE